MTYGVCDRDGKLVHQVPIDLPGVRASHDITITQNYSILHDFPFFQDPELLQEHGFRVARFHRDIPSRFGVIPRRGGTDDVRWFEFEPGYVLHMVNAGRGRLDRHGRLLSARPIDSAKPRKKGRLPRCSRTFESKRTCGAGA